MSEDFKNEEIIEESQDAKVPFLCLLAKVMVCLKKH